MQLLEHFKELSLHPKNAKELKGLILQLAVQGNLTEKWRKQNPDVEISSVLLARIEQEKIRLITEKKIKKEKAFDPIRRENLPFEIPITWNWSRLGAFTFNFGQKQPNQEFEYIDVSSIDNNLGIIKNDLSVINPEDAPSRARKIVKKGCVLYSTVRPYMLNIACVDRDFEHEIIASTAFAILTPYLENDERYLYHLLRSRYFIEFVENCMKGVAYPAINDSQLLNAIIPIPPLAEQKAIVEVVNQLFTEVDQLETLTKKRIQLKEDFATSALRQLSVGNTSTEWAFLKEHFSTFFTEKSNIKKLRESILQLAVQGNLTAQWRSKRILSGVEVERASELLERIKAEKAKLIKEKKIKKENPLPKITQEEIPYELPEGWVWCRLADTTELITKGSSPKWQGVQYVEEGQGILFVTSENVGSYKLIWKNKKYVESKFNEIEPRSILKRGDLLMNIVGGSIGRTAIYDIDDLANINQAVTIIRLIPIINHNYFLNFFNSPICISYMFDKQVDNARPNLSMGNIAKFLIPLPPLSEQKVIVEKVNALMALCDTLELAIAESKQTQEQWMASSLREVFEGEIAEELGMVAEGKVKYINSNSEQDYAKRKQLGLQILSKSAIDLKLGKVKFEKLLHLCEYHIVKDELNQNYYKDVAGPLDSDFTYRFLKEAEKEGYIQIKEQGSLHQINVNRLAMSSIQTDSISDAIQTKIENLVGHFMGGNFEKPEIISTLYAVWNNRLIKKELITDELLKQDFLAWDKKKIKYQDQLDRNLNWMRLHGIVPDGWGKVVERRGR